ncbi:MAG: DUF1778 domain-containing protein [Candidatus Solibacter usitatus]|nr:DUF1778 domain-containing protein [Candidatus Solibacter usitatus]
MTSELLHIFDPRRNFQLQGFSGRGATTTISPASRSQETRLRNCGELTSARISTFSSVVLFVAGRSDDRVGCLPNSSAARSISPRSTGLRRRLTDCVLDAARAAAEEALVDRTVFVVNPKAYAEFLARLDAPPRPNVRLRRSMQTSAPWEK